MFVSETDRTFPGSTLIVAFSGWVDAAGVGTGAAEHLAMGGDVVGHLDPDEIFDYRVNRPTVDFIDGKLQSVDYPEVTLRSVTFGDASLSGDDRHGTRVPMARAGQGNGRSR